MRKLKQGELRAVLTKFCSKVEQASSVPRGRGRGWSRIILKVGTCQCVCWGGTCVICLRSRGRIADFCQSVAPLQFLPSKLFLIRKNFRGKKLPLRHGLDGKSCTAMSSWLRTIFDRSMNSSTALSDLNLIEASSFGQYLLQNYSTCYGQTTAKSRTTGSENHRLCFPKHGYYFIKLSAKYLFYPYAFANKILTILHFCLPNLLKSDTLK